MGGVACLAISFLNGNMGKGTLDHLSFRRRLFLGLFLGKLHLHLHRIRMALSTKALRVPEEQFLLFGGMRFVAVQTTRLVDERPVDSILIKRVIHHAAMAPSTEFVTRSSCLKRSWGIGGLVALGTDLIGNRLMDVIKQDSSPVRAMGVMAGRTIRLFDGVVHVLLSKSRAIGLMTAYAECNQIVFQKMKGLRRGMRIMTIRATFLHRVVFESYLGNGTSYILMTVKTELVPCLQKDKLVLGGMRIMAFYTVALDRHSMAAFLILGHHLSVTFETNPVGVFL